MITTIFVVLLVTIVYYLVKTNFQYWKKRGIPGPKPKFLVGNMGKAFILKAQPGEIYCDIYRQYKGHSVVGIFRSFTPVLLIRDPDLIKEMAIKSFSHFRDNDIEVDKKTDPLFGRNPFALKGEEWKTVRAQLTPGFTSGKMKLVYSHLEANSEKMVKFIEEQPDATNGRGYEAKELSTRFTLNNVADSVFGINAKCFVEENSDFRQLAKDFLSPGDLSVFALFAATVFPVMLKVFPIRFIKKKVEDKLTDIVSYTLEYREKNNIVRNDFLHIINQLKKTCKENEFTDLDVTAHAAAFFSDGYETSSMVMSFVLFQISANPEAQAKLREEITNAFHQNGNKLPYEALQALSYLDAVVNETLRIIPPIYHLQKVCTEPYTYTVKETGKPLVIEKGTPIVFPIYGLHTDPQYFEEPEVFKPERFLGENRDNIRKCTFMPFGEGPRTCLGQRFGLLQIKVGLSYIIKNYELTVNRKTQLPLKFDPTNILVSPIGGLWLDFKKID